MSAVIEQHDRQKFLGGSDVAAVFGLSKWKTPFDLWKDKTTPRSDQPEELDEAQEEFFRDRKDQEPVIAGKLKRKYGIEVTKLSLDNRQNRYRDPEHDFMAAEIDFEFLMSPAVRKTFKDRPEFASIADGTLLNGEIKTSTPWLMSEWGEQGSEEVPTHYAAQVMHGLGVTNRPATLLVCAFDWSTLLPFPIMRDDETLKVMRADCVRFWTEHVLKNVPPPPIKLEDVQKMYAKFKGKPVVLSEDGLKALRRIEELRIEQKVAESEEKRQMWTLAQDIAAGWGVAVVNDDKGRPVLAATENALLMHTGRQVGSWNRQRGASLDQKRLKIDSPELVAKYTKEHHYRVLRFKS